MNKPFVIDNRKAEDLRKQFKTLSAAYTPEWKFDAENPDIGSILALIFTRQMEGNISLLNQIIPKFHTEFVNMLSISLLPAQPASGIVLMDLIRDTVPGVDVPKGTKLLGRGEQDDLPIIFETRSDIHITNAAIQDILMISPQAGKILPLLHGPKKVRLHENEAMPEPNDSSEALLPFKLFDFSGEGIARNALLIYHKTLFASDDGIIISLSGGPTGEKLGSVFSDSDLYCWQYLSEEGTLVPFDSVTQKDGDIVLLKKKAVGKETVLGVPYALIVVEALQQVRETFELSSISLKSSSLYAPPAFISHNEEELSLEEFMPFGETASIFDECYIGDDTVFSQQDAQITLRFSLSFKEKLISFSKEQEDEQLKIIKRKPRSISFDTARTQVDRITIEYFNGNGWRKLPLDHDSSTLFSGDHEGEHELSFLCPDDWQPLTIGGYRGRSLRLRVAQADNCYLQPCIHRMPVLKGSLMRYEYPEGKKLPQRLQRVSGTAIKDLTKELLSGLPVTAFAPLPYTHNGLYLGFDRPLSGTPISLLFEVEQCAVSDPAELSFDYSTTQGFKPLKVLDHTSNLSALGTVMFAPPSDFAAYEVEGIKSHWLRITDTWGACGDPKRFHPSIRAIRPNAVEVHNVETLPQESFYIDYIRPNMSFPLAAQNILSADVFVNEKGLHTPAAMKQLAKDNPSDVQISYNFLGGIEEFFVRWTEVNSFASSSPADRHYMIDRMENRILFGDGVGVSIPRAQNEESFRVSLRCCRGEGGNLPAGSIDGALARILHIEHIENPVPTWSGTNLESVEKAHQRGAGILCSQNRLFSRQDYLREIRLYSSSIEKVSCVMGRDQAGRLDERIVSIVVMMRDYKNGSYSFSSIKDRLRAGILSKCETSLTSELLHITEPIYVALTVTVFAHLTDHHETFTVQNLINQTLSDYIDPLSEFGEKWEIGQLPSEDRLRLLLSSIRSAGIITKFMVTASYNDHLGAHECSLSDLKVNPFMIGVNGQHRTIVTLR